jgi:hypothetical protein
MAAGRLIFGLGAESMIVAITVIIGQWFIGRQLGFAFGVNLRDRAPAHAVRTCRRRGSSRLPTWVAAARLARRRLRVADDRRLRGLLRPRSPRRRQRSAAAETADRIAWDDLWRFDRSYWYRRPLRDVPYSVIFPFRSTFAIQCTSSTLTACRCRKRDR